MNNFSKYDTVIAIKGNGIRVLKGFLLEYIQGKFLKGDNCKTVYLFNNKEKKLEKFYGKKHIITIYSTRLVLTEKDMSYKIMVALEKKLGIFT